MLRYVHLFILVAAAVATASPIPDTVDARSTTKALTLVPLYRAYNPADGVQDHFYTADWGEYVNAVHNMGYAGEGTACHIHDTQEPGTVPLYRMCNPSISDHFYTTSAPEKENALQNGYHDEGATGYIYPNPVISSVPLYRLWSAALTDHFYTMNLFERNEFVAKGYVDEPIPGYVYSP